MNICICIIYIVCFQTFPFIYCILPGRNQPGAEYVNLTCLPSVRGLAVMPLPPSPPPFFVQIWPMVGWVMGYEGPVTRVRGPSDDQQQQDLF